MMQRKENEAKTFGLGDAVFVAETIEKRHKELTREFKLSPLKGVRSQATVQKRKAKDAEDLRKEHEKAYNPRIKGLDGIDGITTAEDGTIGLAELREQRPDVFLLKPEPVGGKSPTDRIRVLHEKMMAAGRKDRYGHALD